MPTLTVTKNYLDNTTLTQTELDQAFQSIETFVNTTKLDSSNLQNAAVGSAQLAAAAVSSSNIATNAVGSNQLSSDLTINSNRAVTTNHIQDSAVTTAKLADANVTTAKLADANVTTAKLADANVTTAKLADGSVTQAKRAALSYQLSTSSGNFSTTSTSYVNVTNLSVTITTTGRPVIVTLQSATTSGLDVYQSGSVCSQGGNVAGLRFLRDGSVLQVQVFDAYNQVNIPPSAFLCFDTPTAGTHTYTVQVVSSYAATTVYVGSCALLAYEL